MMTLVGQILFTFYKERGLKMYNDKYELLKDCFKKRQFSVFAPTLYWCETSRNEKNILIIKL